MNDQNKNIYISSWLMLITSLVGLMIVIGGLTRFTDSGLAITRWDLISGILPPFSLKDWEIAFSLYKDIPEYKLINSTMTLDEFKFIYYWEYGHRLLGRLIGIVYLLPLIFFTWKGFLNKKMLISFYSIFFLITFQGFIGWYMVTSGLVERTDVSHFRLSLHLTVAFIIFILLFWNYLKLKNKERSEFTKKLPLNLPNIFFLLIIIQIGIGAFVSGLDAGKIYQTWPLMDEKYFPDDSNFKDLFLLSSLNNPSILQFIHRNVAYLILLIPAIFMMDSGLFCKYYSIVFFVIYLFAYKVANEKVK